MNVLSVENAVHTALALHSSVRLAILFGSLAAGKGQSDSDVDLAIDMGEPLGFERKMFLIGELAKVTGRPIDLVDLQVVGEPLLGQIVKYGKRVVGDDFAYAELIKRHLFAEADFMPYVRRILEERRTAWIAK